MLLSKAWIAVVVVSAFIYEIQLSKAISIFPFFISFESDRAIEIFAFHCLAFVGWMFVCVDRIPQGKHLYFMQTLPSDLKYHQFADQRRLCCSSVPNAADVLVS